MSIAAISTMQYSHYLDFLIREVVIEDPSLGPIYVLKADVRDVSFCIALQPEDAPKMGIVSPLAENL